MFLPSLHRKVRHAWLPVNSQGRDFAVGDVHGHFDALMRLLRAVKFSPSKGDRLLSVGDLIDRGPESSRCLRLLNRSWFHMVLGNHDIAFVMNLTDPPRLPTPDRLFYIAVGEEGGQWYMRHDRRDLLPLAAKLDARPHILTVGDKRPSFHLVHASLHPFPKIFEPFIIKDKDLGLISKAANQEVMVDSLTSERGLWKESQRQNLPGLSPTYCGHTPLTDVGWALGHLNLDTGAAYSDSLTLLDTETCHLYSTRTVRGQTDIRRGVVPRMKRRGRARATRRVGG